VEDRGKELVLGRPPIRPRIEALERRVTDLEEAVLELTERLKIPPVEPKFESVFGIRGKTTVEYEPQFKQWPK
jgi:hypothetical protein